MKRILYAILATVSGLVLLFSYRTSLGESIVPSDIAAESTNVSGTTTTTTPTPSATAEAEESTEEDTDTSSSESTTTTTPDAATTSTGLTDGTYLGAAASTRYGDVQVQITVSGGQIVDVTVPAYPQSDRKDIAINNRALPVLIAETTAAQSADVQMVSGATYTSQGYIQSLQSALDQAGA